MTASRASSLARNGAGHSSCPPPTPDRFALVGPSVRLDPRVHAVRRDIADIALADRVFAQHYALPLDHACLGASVAMHAFPSAAAPAVSELLRGEAFAVVDCAGEWAWGYSRHDLYVGYVPIAMLDAPMVATHVVDVPAALVFSAADIKASVIERLPMGARFAVESEDGAFWGIGNGFVHRRHAREIATTATDFVAVAESLIGVPYRWGGRSGDGIDCSGLVQLSLSLAGLSAPRDSDQQAAALGDALPDASVLRRGDLVFLPGHVGIMADEARLIHANAHWMRVMREPLADVLARQSEGHGVTAMRRLA